MTSAATNMSEDQKGWTPAERAELKRKLSRSLARQRMRALMLIAPLFIFVVVTFLAPIGAMLLRSVDNKIVPETLPRTVAALQDWDATGIELPGEETYAALYADLKDAVDAKAHTRLGSRLNYEASGPSSLLRKSPRILRRIEGPPYKDQMIDIEEDWGDIAIWRTIKLYSGDYTSGYYVAAADAEFEPDSSVVFKPQREQIYLDLFWRTLLLSVTITLLCLLIGYPVAYLLGTLKAKYANILLILVLLPFWTSLLVRTSAWVVLLQQQGVINDFLVLTGLNSFIYNLSLLVGPGLEVASLCANDMINLDRIGVDFLSVLEARRDSGAQLSLCAAQVVEAASASGPEAALAYGRELLASGQADGYGDERFQMIYNQFGTIVAMTHILLPFMILPLYSVMKTLPPSYVRAAKSLGASNWTAFWRVYFPNTIPGIGAGAILVFILAIGYYITPDLVGGESGTFISNRIAYHIEFSLNWGLAAALSSMLLLVIIVLYFTYDRIVGIANVKLG